MVVEIAKKLNNKVENNFYGLIPTKQCFDTFYDELP